MGGNIERSLIGLQPGDYFKTRLIHRTLGFFGIFEGDPDLITEFRTLVLLQVRYWLGEIVFKKVEEGGVVVL